jgi:acyl-CoA thioesterase-1
MTTILTPAKAGFLQFLLLASLLLAACQGGKYSKLRNLNSPGENVICFGDSLTAGLGVANGEDYPSVLALRIPYPVINAGRSGDTSAAGLARLEQDVLKRNPRLVIVFFGGNDFLRRVPLAETRRNLEAMIESIQENGAMVVLVGMTLGVFRDEYGPVYKEIAKKYNALFIAKVFTGILSNTQLRSDSIHPNAAGYRLMAEKVLKEIKPLLEESDRRRRSSG